MSLQDLSDVGYSQQMKTEMFGRSRRSVANEARRMKKQGDMPPVYPNGWFAILESAELKAEGVRAVNILGTNATLRTLSIPRIKILDQIP